jgi:hypothetical protein
MDTLELHILIEKKLGGASSPEEDLLLDEWFDSSDGHPLFTDMYSKEELGEMVSLQLIKFRFLTGSKTIFFGNSVILFLSLWTN